MGGCGGCPGAATLLKITGRRIGGSAQEKRECGMEGLKKVERGRSVLFGMVWYGRPRRTGSLKKHQVDAHEVQHPHISQQFRMGTGTTIQ